MLQEEQVKNYYFSQVSRDFYFGKFLLKGRWKLGHFVAEEEKKSPSEKFSAVGGLKILFWT